MLQRPSILAPILMVALARLAEPAETEAGATPGDADEGGLFDRAAHWIDRNPRQLREQLAGGGFFPSLGAFAQGTGPSPGLTIVQRRLAGSPLDLMLSSARSLRGDAFDELRVGLLPFAPSLPLSREQTLESLTPVFAAGESQHAFAYAELRRRNLVGGRLFDDQGGATHYRLNDTALDLVVGWRLTPHWLAAFRAGTLSASAGIDVQDGEALAALRGPEGRDRFFRTAAALAFDDRDDPRDPRRGSFAELALSRFENRGGPDGFDRASLELRHFRPLGSVGRVLALRAGATLDNGRGAGTPFYLLDTLGGGDRLRGYQAYRFRGPKLAAFTAEYRHELARTLEAVVFYDAGKVWSGHEAMGTSGLLGSYGAGLRLKSQDGVLLRLEAARGGEGARLNLKLGYAF